MNSLDDVRSDMSVYHRVDEVENMTAHRFVAYAYRLPVYGGALTHVAKQQNLEPAVPQQLRGHGVHVQEQPKDIRELMATDPMFAGIATAVTVPLE